MKKFLAVLCAAAVLTGCAAGEDQKKPAEQAPQAEEQQGQKEEQKPQEQAQKPEKEEKTFRELFQIESEGIDYLSTEGIEIPEKVSISMIGKDADGGFWKRVKAGAEAAVADMNTAMGYTGEAKAKLTYDAPADENVAEQIDIIDQMLDKNPDALIVSFVDVNSGRTQLELADANGVPVFSVDSGIENSLIVSETQTDNYQAGVEAAKKFCEAIGDSGQIALLVHSSKTETGIERERGFTQEISQNHPEVEIVNISYRDQDERSIDEIVASVLTEYPDLKGYFGANEDVTRELLSALSVHAEEGRQITAAGFDAPAKLVQAVRDGKMAGVMAQNPYGMGYAAAIAAFRSIAGLENASEIETGYYWISSENLDDPMTEMLTYK